MISVQRAGNERQEQLAVLMAGSGGCQSVDISHRRRPVQRVQGDWRGGRGGGSGRSVPVYAALGG